MTRSAAYSRWPWLVVALGSLLVWLAMFGSPISDSAGTGREDAEAGIGSRAPCQVPLSWHLTELDPRFALSAAEARRAVEDAAALWEGALGRTLFPGAGSGDLAIRFVFDERQSESMERRQWQQQVDATDASLEGRGEELSRAARRLDRDIARHNAVVSEWQSRGGAPPEVLAELRATGSELDQREQTLQRQIDQFNRRVAERNRQAEDLTREFAPEVVESGYYGESVRLRGERVLSVSDREIQIFQFEDYDALVLVIAHELGHALGLGHAPGPDAVMSSIPGGAVSGIQPKDLALLRKRCPRLASNVEE